MPIIKSEDLLAIKNKNGIFCLECSVENKGEDEAVTVNDIKDDEVLICDCCNEIIYEG